MWYTDTYRETVLKQQRVLGNPIRQRVMYHRNRRHDDSTIPKSLNLCLIYLQILMLRSPTELRWCTPLTDLLNVFLWFTYSISYHQFPLKITSHSLFSFKKKPKVWSLKTFMCLYFSSFNHSNLHKLDPRSTLYLFLGYPSLHTWYISLDLKTRKNYHLQTRLLWQNRLSLCWTKIFIVLSLSWAWQWSFLVFKKILQSRSFLLLCLRQKLLYQLQSRSSERTNSQPIVPAIEPPKNLMQTRSKTGVRKPKKPLTLLLIVSPIPNNRFPNNR